MIAKMRIDLLTLRLPKLIRANKRRKEWIGDLTIPRIHVSQAMAASSIDP